MDIKRELEAIIAAKQGNKELSLSYDELSPNWSLEIGNPSQFVSLGEVVGEISVIGKSIEEVIIKAKEALGLSTKAKESAMSCGKKHGKKPPKK